MDEENKVEEEIQAETPETPELDNSQSVPEEEPQIEEEVDTYVSHTEDDYEKKVQESRELQARAKRAEQKLKELEGKVNQKPLTNNELTRDEVVLIAKGTDIEVLDEAKALAQALNIPLLEAIKRPSIVALTEKKSAEERSARASLGTGKSTTRVENRLDQPGLSDEEHRKLWEKAMQG